VTAQEQEEMQALVHELGEHCSVRTANAVVNLIPPEGPSITKKTIREMVKNGKILKVRNVGEKAYRELCFWLNLKPIGVLRPRLFKMTCPHCKVGFAIRIATIKK